MVEKLHIEVNENNVAVSGPINIRNLKIAKRKLRENIQEGSSVDLGNLTMLDSAGALLLTKLDANLTNIPEEYARLLELVANAGAGKLPHKERLPMAARFFIHVGKASADLLKDTKDLTAFLGHSVVALFAAITKPHLMRWGSIVHHIEAVGIRAVPIVSVIAFAIAVILAYQGVEQLKPLGAEQFTVNLITISVLREMGVLLTAIMLAGRSGSAFTAEIGVMKLREEVDALKATGLDPFQMLVVPRLIAIIICLPLLTFVADIMGLLGGAVMSAHLIDLSFKEYIDQVKRVASLKIFFVGLVKAPVFALVIAIVGCMHGMRVSGSSESVGTETTAAVVKSIFLVLILDALFSVLFQKMGI